MKRLAAVAIIPLVLLGCAAEERVATSPSPAAVPAPAAPVEAEGAWVIFETTAGDAPFRVEVARTEPERRLGLMHRTELPGGRGMLFLMEDERVQTFWMKNTLIPLDMIFVNERLEVVGVVENAAPLTETLRTVGVPSRFVVEIAGGHARPAGIEAGVRMRVKGVADFPPPATLDKASPLP
jgi:uncharacterized protein